MKKNEYKCDMCKEIFKEGWSKKEALKEMEDNFGKVLVKERAIICDDCYIKFMKWYQKNERNKTKNQHKKP